MYNRAQSSWTKHWDFMLLDIACLLVAYVLAYIIRFPNEGLIFFEQPYGNLVLILCVSQLLASLLLNNLGGVLKRGWLGELVAMTILFMATIAIVSLFLFAAHIGETYSRLVVYISLSLFFFIDYFARNGLKHYLRWKKARDHKQHKGSRSLLVVTQSESEAQEIIDELQENVLEDFDVRGLVLLDRKDTESVLGIPVIGELEQAAGFICREWIDEVLVYLPESAAQPKAFLSACAEMGVTVHSVLNLRNVESSKQFVETIGERTVLTTAFNYIAPYQAFIKRAMDIAGGIVGSLAAILIGLVLGPIIYINSPGPIIFKQRRIGKNGRQFWVYKFRSMYLDAEERKKDLMDENRVADGMMFKMDFDPRIIGNRILPDGTRKTGIGEFIRKTSLDEFPQFFNVLRGDMSLVGTRPPTVDEWEKYEYHHRARLAIKPGITGLWQVSGRSAITDFEQVVKLDTEYICTYRLLLDIKILFKTVIVLLQRKGAM